MSDRGPSEDQTESAPPTLTTSGARESFRAALARARAERTYLDCHGDSVALREQADLCLRQAVLLAAMAEDSRDRERSL